MSYARFSLTLMVTHACNMRCTYCYTGAKAARRMEARVGDASIRRGLASVAAGGTLELGFFGGEPLLEAGAIGRWMDLARREARATGKRAAFHLTTNGTLTTPGAWEVLMQPDLHVAVSCDGLPEVHDRFRIFAGGAGTAQGVRATIERLIAGGKEISVVMVVRPETASSLARGMRALKGLGVKSLEPSLDLWTRWTAADATVLRQAIAEAAEEWQAGLPECQVSWFDEKVVELSGLSAQGVRCGFGDGEVAVAPSGNLYPCERLIGEDGPGRPMRLAGHVLDGGVDFMPQQHAEGRSAQACGACSMRGQCGTYCRCSNFVRTGDVRTPDGLLCLLNQACLEEVALRVVPTLNGARRVSLPQAGGASAAPTDGLFCEVTHDRT